MTRLDISIVSYNRGPFLRHCVQTVQQCLPWASITVRDDGSDDPETCEILARLANQVTVIRRTESPHSKHGGLYAHMQAALEATADDALLLFLQDDLQAVRSVAADELQAWWRLFSQGPELGFLSPSFVPASGRKGGIGRFDLERERGLFWPEEATISAGIHYSDVSLCWPQRLREQGWSFHAREATNDAQARHAFGRMPTLAAPFLAWLPLVPAYRGRRKTWALQQVERRRNAGFHPFAPLSAEEVSRLHAARDAHPPIADDWLHLRESDVPKPWHHNAMQGQRGWRRLNSFETRLRRWSRT
ncbi:MAG: glycosyltransferase family A protein [Oceanococcaceae bacterium]